MKKKLTLSAVFLSSLIAVTSISCKKNKEKTNADYAGTWSVSETCTSAWSYQMTIATSGSDGVTITNFHKGTNANGFTVTGTVDDKTLTIPSQSASCSSQGGPYTFAGTGTLSDDGKSLTFKDYTMKDVGGNTLKCTANCTK